MRDERSFYAGAVPALVRGHLERARWGERLAGDPLNNREVDVVKLIAERHTSREIADLLLISPTCSLISERPVERHVENILEELDMDDRVELTRHAIRHGLIEP
jgi:DNA-binding CsgD family transcriptional regulator